jgi:hypothetical protein
MPAYHVQRSTEIDASPEKVFDARRFYDMDNLVTLALNRTHSTRR